MIGDHHGWTAGRATLLVRAVDEILGTHKTNRAPATALAGGRGWSRSGHAPDRSSKQ
jgi:hypothetical protein